MRSYRVDEVPAWWRPLLFLYGYGLGFALFVYYLIQRATIVVEIEGQEHLVVGSSCIFCHWHGSIPLTLQSSVPRIPPSLRGRSQAWMQHPLWYMKPIHVALRLMGVRKLVLGSTGHDGRQAAEQLVDFLRRGYSTFLFPDGPAGPPRVLKKGILHIARESEVPIVPLRVTASRFLATRSWDRKQHPVPFSRIRVRVGEPVEVTEKNFEQAERRVREALG